VFSEALAGVIVAADQHTVGAERQRGAIAQPHAGDHAVVVRPRLHGVEQRGLKPGDVGQMQLSQFGKPRGQCARVGQRGDAVLDKFHSGCLGSFAVGKEDEPGFQFTGRLRSPDDAGDQVRAHGRGVRLLPPDTKWRLQRHRESRGHARLRFRRAIRDRTNRQHVAVGKLDERTAERRASAGVAHQLDGVLRIEQPSAVERRPLAVVVPVVDVFAGDLCAVGKHREHRLRRGAGRRKQADESRDEKRWAYGHGC